MPHKYKIDQGALMRCCLKTLDDYMAEQTEPPKEGDILSCAYESDPENQNMIYSAGVWRWYKERFEKP